MVFMSVISFKNDVRTAKQRRSPKNAASGCTGSSVEACWIPLTPEHGFPSLFFTTRHEALPSCPPKLNWGMPFSLPFQQRSGQKNRSRLIWPLLSKCVLSQASLRWHYPNQVIGRRSHLPLSLYYKLPSVQLSYVLYLDLPRFARLF